MSCCFSLFFKYRLQIIEIYWGKTSLLLETSIVYYPVSHFETALTISHTAQICRTAVISDTKITNLSRKRRLGSRVRRDVCVISPPESKKRAFVQLAEELLPINQQTNTEGALAHAHHRSDCGFMIKVAIYGLAVRRL